MMTKLLIGLLGAGVLATGGYAAANGLESGNKKAAAEKSEELLAAVQRFARIS